MSLSSLSVKRPIFITCVIIAIVVFGAFCFKNLPIDLFPDVNIPTVSVSTIYAGAGPNEIETLVTKPLEDSFSNIAGVKKMTSKSYEGMSQVTIEFNQGVDSKYAEQLVRDKVNQTKSKFPDETKEPVITKVDLSALPVLMVILNGDLPDAELFDLADQMIKPQLEQVDKVGSVEVLGGRKREIQVLLDRNILRQKQISVSQVAAQLAAAGDNIPSGNVDSGLSQKTFRSLGEFKTTKDVANTVVSLFGNENGLRVSDLGTVKDTVIDEKVRLTANGKKAILLQIFRQSGSNTVAVTETVKKKIESISAELKTMPGSPALTIVIDSSTQIKNEIADVYETIIIGIILTILTVFVFLNNSRSTFITGLSLPISLIGAFSLIYLSGFSVNIVTLLSLSLAVGLLIDDAIVVIENIFRRIELGEKVLEATINGCKEIQISVTAISLVVISVFLPFAFMQGTVGQFLKQFGLTVGYSMAISLFVALTVVPMLTAYMVKDSEDHHQKSWLQKLLLFFDRFQTWLSEKYESSLVIILRNPKKIVAITLVIFIVCSLSLLKVSKSFMPEQDNGTLLVNLEKKPGTNLDGMEEVARKVEGIINQHPDVKITTVIIGSRNGEKNKSTMFISLKDIGERKTTTSEFKTWLRPQLDVVADANPIIQNFDITGAGGAQPLMIDLTSSDGELLDKYAKTLIAKLKQDQRLKDVDSSVEDGKPEFQIVLNDKSAETYGVNTRTMGYELRGQIEGHTPSKFREKGKEYDVRVRLKEDQRNLEKNFYDTYIPNINYRQVRLADVAQGKNAETVNSIARLNRARHIQITADVAPGFGLGDILQDLQGYIKTELKLPPEVRLSYAGNSDMYGEMMSSMLIAFAFCIFLIFLILSSLYESFITPFTILISLPLALCGAFVALFFTQNSLNIYAFFGIFMLLGVAGKNSILLVDFIVQRIAEGMDRTSAIISAGKDRLRPILMTSFALIAGAIPIAIGLNPASKLRTSMGVSIIGGLISSTILTLIVVPVVFVYIDRFRLWLKKSSKK